MKKAIILGIALAFAMAGAAQQSKDSTSGNYKGAIETLGKTIDSLSKQANRSLTDSLARVNNAMEEIKKKNNAFDWKAIMPWLLTVIAIVFTYLGYTREGSYRHLTFLTDKNKMMVTDPKLWAIYDSNRVKYNASLTITGPSTLTVNEAEELLFMQDGTINLSPAAAPVTVTNSNATTQISEPANYNVTKDSRVKITGKATIQIPAGIDVEIKSLPDKEMDAKIRAFCYYNLNSFELVLKYNRGRNSRSRAWENYMIYTLVKSSMFSKIVEDEIRGSIFDEQYQERLKSFLAVSRIMKKLIAEGKKEWSDNVFNYTERLSFGLTNNYITENSSAGEVEEFLKLQS